MTRLTLELKPHVAESLDRVVRAEWNEEPTHWTRHAVLVNLLLDRARQLPEGGRGEDAGDHAQQPRHEEPDAGRRERDALRKALQAERATRRRDRERHARTRASLRNARGAVSRLDESRAGYRHLALRVEAALLRAPLRDDPSALEDRLRRALRDAGFVLPDSRIPARSGANSRAPPRSDSPPKRRKTS